MKEKPPRLPLQHLTSASWLNLALAALLLFELIYIAWQVLSHMLCGQLAVDYCDFWSAATVANRFGYPAIYNLRVLGQAQSAFWPAAGDPSSAAVVPFPYLPIFVLPFQLLGGLTPAPGFWLWTAVNAVVYLAYLRFFAGRMMKRPLPAPVILMAFAALPAFMNFFLGQTAVWLALSVGEFMRAFVARKPFRAGLWLAALLLKPQVLVLIALLLVLQRAWKVIGGLAVGSLVTVIGSLLLIGFDGFVQMLRLWIIYASGQANTWVEGMMNWRMLGVHLSNIAGPWIGWGLVTVGMLVTLVITLRTWRFSFDPDSIAFPVAVLGILAAGALLAWHSHIHMAVMLVPPIIYLHQTNALPRKLLNYWIFVPALLFFAVTFIPETLQALGILSGDIRPFVYFIMGAGEFSANAYVFWWAVHNARPAPPHIPLSPSEQVRA